MISIVFKAAWEDKSRNIVLIFFEITVSLGKALIVSFEIISFDKLLICLLPFFSNYW